MKKTSLAALAATCLLVACSSAPPIPELPEDAKTTAFGFKREVFQRGLTGGTNHRPPRLLNHVYSLKCVATDPNRPAKQRFNEARAIINKTELLVYQNTIGEGYQKSFQRNRVNRNIVERTGCEVSSFDWEVITTETNAILKWVVKNGVLKEATGQG